jgi:gag-polypeptide of LTR copia-type
MAETYPNELWMKLEGMYLSKSLTSQTTLKKWLYQLRMEEGMNLRVHLDVFNTLMRDVFNAGGKIEKDDQACLFRAFMDSGGDRTSPSAGQE